MELKSPEPAHFDAHNGRVYHATVGMFSLLCGFSPLYCKRTISQRVTKDPTKVNGGPRFTSA